MIYCSINLEQYFCEFINIYFRNQEGQRFYNRINFYKKDGGDKIKTIFHTEESIEIEGIKTNE